MNLLQQIQDLPLDIQVNRCGESLIKFINIILENDETHYKFDAKIGEKTNTMSTIFIDCKILTPKIYIPDYFETHIKDYIYSDKTLMILNVTLCNVYKNYNHSNALIINKNLKTVERFEPHGKPMDYYDDLIIENRIKQFIYKYFPGFYYLSPYVFIGNEGPQNKVKLKLNLEFGRGFCVNYTILYVYLRCKEKLNPYESIDFINSYFLDDNILKFTNFINTTIS